jgi:glutaredoxin-related protein
MTSEHVNYLEIEMTTMHVSLRRFSHLREN